MIRGNVVAERVRGNSVRFNPLVDDLVLFGIYMSALDEVIANREIRAALDEFGVSPNTLRMQMITQARRVFEEVPQEFAAYEAARGVPGWEPQPVSVRSFVRDPFRLRRILDPPLIADAPLILRFLTGGTGIAGCLLAVAGVASIPLWPWTESLVWAGGTLIVLAGMLFGLSWLVNNGVGLRLGDSIWASDDPQLGPARNALMAAVGGEELLAQARTFINVARQDRFGHAYSVVNISGLSETYDSTYQVPTGTATELDGLIDRLDGASIGVAGPRGSGKSTLIRGYCNSREPALPVNSEPGLRTLLDEVSRQDAASGDLRCMVSAPVDYAASEFVLHLFAAFCRSVIQRFDTAVSSLPGKSAVDLLYSFISGVEQSFRGISSYLILWVAPAALLLHWQSPIAELLRIPGAWTYYSGIAVAVLGAVRLARAPARAARRVRAAALVRNAGDNGKALAAAARRHLTDVRYLQTSTSGWFGSLAFPGGAGGQYSRAIAQAEQPLSYPEIVAEFRAFARDVAAELHRRGARVFVGIDELDKIGAPEQAERFLNEIKGIFGIPHLYFMVSVSDDALTSFERRGLPLRDAFDSSFDEIIHVGPLSYTESRRLLYRRVIGLTEPYVALCHCLAGGLARDLIRAARQVGRASETSADGSPLATAGLDRLDDNRPAAFRPPHDEAPHRARTLSAICAAVVRDELRRKARAVTHAAISAAPSQGQELHDTLNYIAHHIAVGEPAIKIVDFVGHPAAGEPDSVTRLRLDFATYAYYCATLQEVFTDQLDPERLVKATGTSSAQGSFDSLAEAREAFTIDTQLAWRSITQFRQAWSLETREPFSGRPSATEYEGTPIGEVSP
jgi:hypothetical protein